MALFLTGWSQMPASRACHGCSQASDLSRQGARQRQRGHLAFQWRLDPLLGLPHWDLDFKSNDEGPKASTDGRVIKLYEENNIYNFYVKDLDGNWQAQNFDTSAAESVLPRSYAESVQQLSGGSRQALSAKADFRLQGRLQPRPVCRAVAVSRIPTWMLCLDKSPRPGRSREECRGVWRGWSGSPRPICSGRSRGG